MRVGDLVVLHEDSYPRGLRKKLMSQPANSWRNLVEDLPHISPGEVATVLDVLINPTDPVWNWVKILCPEGVGWIREKNLRIAS